MNVLANVCRVPLEQVFAQFDGSPDPKEEGSGDVKYHLGIAVDRINRSTQKPVKVAVVANPSHLEAVDPIVLGSSFIA